MILKMKGQTVQNPSEEQESKIDVPGSFVEDTKCSEDVSKQPESKSKSIITDEKKEHQQKNEKTKEIVVRHQTVEQSAPPLLEVKSMTEIFDTTYMPRRPVVENFLYNGTYLFAGAPKVGKSFFMAQLGYHVSKGIPLWGMQVNQGAVLYLALEDTEDRLQKRLGRMFGTDSSSDFYFAVQAETLATGLEDQMNEFVENHKNARLIIIDTLQKIRELGTEQNSYPMDYQNVTKLKKFSDKHGVCIILVHHTRKQEASDSFDKISGTNGLLGAADGAFVMEKEKRTGNKATIDVAGRDQQDQRLFLQFDREHCYWQLIKTDVELWKSPPNPLLKAIADFLTQDVPEWSGSATELLEQIHDVEIEANKLTRALNIAVSELLQDYGIQYTNKHTNKGSLITLRLLEPEKVTISDDVTIKMTTVAVPKVSSLSSPPSPEGGNE